MLSHGIYSVALLVLSNIFMTFAWYGHLKLREYSWFDSLPLIGVIAFSWAIAFFEQNNIKIPNIKNISK